MRRMQSKERVNWRLSWKLRSAFLVICVGSFSIASLAQESHPLHWSYAGKDDGPQNWGQLDPAYATCASGHAQSPIDIKGAKLAELPSLKFDYSSVALNIINNGHTIQVNYPPGSTLTVGGKTYTLKQFHFHHPSEEEINGRGFDLVAHLVHDDGSGHLAVVAVLFKRGAANPLLDVVWKNIPTQMEKALDVLSVRLNANDLLPADKGYYTFNGSLTTPPCSEGVTWYVLKNSLTVSTDQVAAFAKLYPHNARPIQPLFGREILATK
jgi:carbonic anhydrase